MLKQLRHKEEGVVFVTVLMIIIVMMILVISILSINVSQVMITESETKRVQAEIIARGALDYFIANQLSNSAGNYITYSETLNGTDFQVTINMDETNPSLFDPASSLNILVDY